MRRRMSVDDARGLRPHDHAVWFGDGPGELHAMASGMLAEGLRRHEKLMFIAPEPDPAGLVGLGDVEWLLAKGWLEAVSVESVYGDGRTFSAATQLAAFQSVLSDALADGYSGIRVVADNTPLADGSDEQFERWLAWEQMTDHFQAAASVTGVCFFDRTALSRQRQADLAALHPVRGAGTVEPPFSLFVEGDAVLVVGSLDVGAGGQLRRLLATLDLERHPVLDLSGALLVDDDALLALAELAELAAHAGAELPLELRGDEQLRARVASLGEAGRNLRVEHAAGAPHRCARCGDVIGVYEQAVIVFADDAYTTSALAEPDAVRHAAARYHSACRPER